MTSLRVDLLRVEFLVRRGPFLDSVLRVKNQPKAFFQMFSETPSGHGRLWVKDAPAEKSCFPALQVMGRKFLARDVRPDIPPDVHWISTQELSLWAGVSVPEY